MTAMTKDERKALKRLTELGWDDAPKLLRQWCPKGFARLLKRYQRMHGIKADGKLGPITERSLDALRVCGLPEQMNVNRSCKWPKSEITFAVTGAVPGVSAADQKAAYVEAYRRWSVVANIKATYTSNSRTADVIMGSGHIDGPSGTLAWSELPCGNPRQLTQKYDTGEPWAIFDGPSGGRGRIDLVRVACHEIGHVIGIPHIGSDNLMAPTYGRGIWTPQGDDIAEAQARYGKPVNPEPTPEPAPEVPVPTEPDRIQTIQIQYLGQKPFAVKY